MGLTNLALDQGHIYHRLHAPITCTCWYVHIYVLLVYNAPSVPHCNELEVLVPVSQGTMQWGAWAHVSFTEPPYPEANQHAVLLHTRLGC